MRIIDPSGKSTYKTCKNIEYEASETLAETKTGIDISTLHHLSVNEPNIETNSLPTEEIFETNVAILCQQKKGNFKVWLEINCAKLFYVKINNVYQLDWYVQ